MRENWKEIIYVLQTDFKVGMLENKFRDDIAYCLRILGWKPYNGSVRREVSLPIGNNNSIRPDFVLHKDNKEIPIEVKRPGNDCNERQEKQLLSYMRQLKSNVGIYIGSDIRFFYDDPNDSADAICVYKIEFDEDDNNGITFCELLSYDSFDKEYFELFCKEQYEKLDERKRLRERLDVFLNDDKVEDYLKDLIVEMFVKEGFVKDEVEEELSEIRIGINRNFKSVQISQDVAKTDKEYVTNENKVKKTKNCDKFSLNGRDFYPKNRFVLNVVHNYVKEHSNITYEELKEVFYDDLSHQKKFIEKKREIEKDAEQQPDLLKRFFVNDPILLNGNIEIVVNNQWGDSTNFPTFLKHINKFYDYYRRDKRTNEVTIYRKNNS